MHWSAHSSENLVKYLARPPIANDRLSELPDGRLALAFKQPWRDGTTHVVLSPHELVEKLIPLIPRPRAHLVRYHGILGPAAQDRASVVPKFVRPDFGRGAACEELREIDPSGIPRLGRLPWAMLLKRVFLVDVLECPKCKGRMKILAAVTAPASVRRVLGHLGLPSEEPRLRSARPPPQLDLARAESRQTASTPTRRVPTGSPPPTSSGPGDSRARKRRKPRKPRLFSLRA